MNKTPEAEIRLRNASLQKKLVDQGLDGTIILLNSDLYYLTGTVQSSFLFVPANGEPILMIKKSLLRGREESPLKNIVPIRSPKEIPAILAEFGYSNLNKLGLELDVLPLNFYRIYQKIFPQTEFMDISPILKGIRAIKSPYEVELLHESLRVLDKVFLEVPNLLKEDMSEIELAALIEGEIRKRGYSGCCKMRAFNQDFFLGTVCAGSGGAMPSFLDGPVGGAGVTPSHPYGAGWKKIKPNEVVYIDYTSVINGYIGDQTRIFCIGELTPQMRRAYDAALLIEKEILRNMKPGNMAEESYLLAVKIAEEMGYKDNFMGYKDDRVKFVGHGIGLELDEWPILAKGIKTTIQPGMTFALEPTFVFPEGAIGIENSFVMTEKGPEYLSITPEIITYL
jgi:Xaa-Pro aminopeptidase